MQCVLLGKFPVSFRFPPRCPSLLRDGVWVHGGGEWNSCLCFSRKYPGEIVKMQVLGQQVWGGARGSVFLPSSQVA